MAKVKVFITPKKGVLDPAGKTVQAALRTLGYKNISEMRIGKYIDFEIAGRIKLANDKQIKEMCQKLLANPIIEDFRFEVA